MGPFQRWFFATAPAERLAALRIAIGAYALVWVFARGAELISLTRLGREHFVPTGITRLLSAPLPPWLVIALALATTAFLIAFTLGLGYRVTGPLAAMALLWTLTYRGSWGQVFHTDNLLALHVIALACAPAADAWSIDARRRTPRLARDGHGWPIKLMIALTVATYVMAGIAKLRLAGLDWLDGETLRNQIAVDNLRKAVLGAPLAPLATPFLDHPGSLVVVSVLTLAIELGAPLVFWSRRIARVWAVAAWSFHVGVVLLMNIWFPYPLFGFAYLPLFEVERAGPWLRRNISRRRAG